MAETTGIEWTQKTYNPWIGCTKVSPGCTHCYAETFSLQKKWLTKWGKDGERVVTKTASDPVEWNQEALEKRTRYTVFCASLSDVFEEHPELPPLRNDLWRLVKRTPFLNWMILTKRAENIARMLPEDWGEGYANVCLMVSVESQKYFDERVPLLQAVPARYRALSVEPLVAPLQMPQGSLQGIDLVIVGGESGKEARPMNPDWVRNARDVCAREKVKFFFKQWGNWTPDKTHSIADAANGAAFTSYDAKPIQLSGLPLKDRKALLKQSGVQVVHHIKSKKTGGSLLDGKEHKAHIFQNQSEVDANSSTILILPLEAQELVDLANLERVVTEGLAGFWKAGEALREIRDRGLYRDTHTSFADYCREKWEISRIEAYRQIGAAEVIEDIAAGSPSLPLPENAAQTRPLLQLKTPGERRRIWNDVTASGVTVTAKVVEEAVTKLRSKGRKTRAGKAAKTTLQEPNKVKAQAALADLKAALGGTFEKRLKSALKTIEAFIQ